MQLSLNQLVFYIFYKIKHNKKKKNTGENSGISRQLPIKFVKKRFNVIIAQKIQI